MNAAVAKLVAVSPFLPALSSSEQSFISILDDHRERLLLDGFSVLDVNRQHKAAVSRVIDGTFGRCQACHELISLDLFMKDPFALVCSGLCRMSLFESALDDRIKQCFMDIDLFDKGTRADLANTKIVTGNHAAEGAREASINMERLEKHRKLINKLAAIKQQMAIGSYETICQECEEDIPLDVLLIHPERTLCTPCKEQLDRMSKVSNGMGSKKKPELLKNKLVYI